MSTESKAETTRKKPRGLIAGFAAVLALGGGIKYGPGAYDYAEGIFSRATTDPSLIVSGVPGQVEDMDSKLVSTGKTAFLKYWLEIEQCPADIATAEADNPTTSYNPGVGQISPDCNIDWVLVNADAYRSVAIGDPIIVNGNFGEKLRK